jgi:tripartite-type tricarboxylate transporter receptor subunit TctC
MSPAFRTVLAAMLLAVFVPGTALAQSYPSKLVRIVNPFATGGPTDPPVRWIAQKLSETWNQPVIVDFRGGASGNIGADIVAKSAPDGYTLLFITSSFVLSAVTSTNLPFDPVKDFQPITPFTSGPTLLVVHPSTGVSNVKDFIALAKKNPGKMSYGSSGQGGPLHLYMELFKTMSGIDIVHIPYKGAGPAVAEVLAGRLQAMFVGMPAVVSHMKSGKVIAIGNSSMERAQALPDLPTIHEQGLTGFDGGSRYGVLAPARTPADTINRIHAGLVKVVFLPETKTLFAGFGIEPISSTPTEYATWIRSQIERWTQVARTAGIKPE